MFRSLSLVILRVIAFLIMGVGAAHVGTAIALLIDSGYLTQGAPRVELHQIGQLYVPYLRLFCLGAILWAVTLIPSQQDDRPENP